MGEGERKISLSLSLSPQETQQKVTRRDCERKTLLIPHYLLLSAGPTSAPLQGPP